MCVETLDIVGYHGTEIERGRRFLSNNIMEESVGDRHWLGDGSYFYEELFYAYKWIKDMFYKRNGKNHNEFNELVAEYIILVCNINVERNRIFDLDKYEHKYIFDYFFEKLQKEKSHSKRFDQNQMADGVVINILFNEYRYIDKYDIVIASFSRRGNKYKKNTMTRLKNVLEKQICVKNINTVNSINIKDFKCDYLTLDMLVKSLDKEVNLNRYSSRRNKRLEKVCFK